MKTSVALVILAASALLELRAQELPYRTDRILVKPAVNPDRIATLHTNLETRVLKSFPLIGNIQVVQIPPRFTVEQAIEEFRRSGLVEFAEPDMYVTLATHNNPNDPKFTDGSLWAFHNTGQNGGLNDADIDAPEGWHIQPTAPYVVIAVVDSGARYTHEDLSDNMWRNAPELNGVAGSDDDNNGYVDDVYGINAINGTGNPVDTYFHGTLVAGVVGAVGNNGKGVVGVAQDAQIMPLKFFDNSGSPSDAAECFQYALQKGAHIINCSFVQGYNETLKEAVFAAKNRGIVVTASAGNDKDNPQNTDIIPYYPQGFDLDNIISVAATTRFDTLAPFSHYGLVSVDLAAPGGEHGDFTQWDAKDILSTGYWADNDYVYAAGTSFSAPMVARSGSLAEGQISDGVLSPTHKPFTVVDGHSFHPG